MPNHFTVVCICRGDWNALEKAGKKDFDLAPLENVDFCGKVLPMPEELEGIVKTEPPCRYRDKDTGGFSRDCNGPDGPGDWEQVPLTKEEIDTLTAKYGGPTWYEWSRDNWGTKWGTYGTKAYKLGGDGCPVMIEFQCAWGPPKKNVMDLIEEHLKKEYYLEQFHWLYHDPGSGTVGILHQNL